MDERGIGGGRRADIPDWVPDDARRYIRHTEQGISIRELARGAGCHASTVMRQVRKYEARRDDLLIDLALQRFGRSASCHAPNGATDQKDIDLMQLTASRRDASTPDDETIDREARRILRRLNEPGACLAVARDMEKAVVVRDTSDGRTIRTGVVERPVAEALALKDWIACKSDGRISRYQITSTGRVALKRLIAEEDQARQRDLDQPTSFADQHRDYDTRHVGDNGKRRRVRYNAAESPLLSLARRRDKDGQPFLGDDLVAAGERLREDFELAQMGPRTTQNWEKFLTGGASQGASGDGGMAEGPSAARDRVLAALTDLGPGLGDVVLRCCCFLEGMEAAERRMGWSARSGKIVLRIALQRLKRHYDTDGNWSPLIG